MGVRDRDVGRSEGRPVAGRIRVQVTRRESELTSDRSLSVREREEPQL